MAGHKEHEPRDDHHWGDRIARMTFVATAAGAALFVGVVFWFIL